LERGDAAAAVKTLDRLIADSPASAELVPRARYVRARARQQLKEFGPAVDDLQAFLNSKPSTTDKSDARYLLGLCQAGLNKPADASKTFRALLADDPHYAATDKVLYELAWAQKADSHEADAAESFARLAKTQPDSPLAAESQYHVGEHYYQQQDYKQAASAFYESMQLAGKSELGQTAAYKLGWAYYRLEEFDHARTTFAFLRGTYPTSELNSDAAFMEGESLLKLEKYKDAIAAYAQVKKPKRADLSVLALLHAAQAQEQLQQWQPALELLDAAGKADTKEQYFPEILYERGWAKQNLGRPGEALELYEDVTRRSDGEVAARARFMIGEIYFEKKDHSEAIRNFFKVAYGYAFPEWQAAAQYEAGRCFEVLGKTDQARQSYQEVVQKYPQSSKAGPAKERLTALEKK
jgi:TolA-binding protein